MKRLTLLIVVATIILFACQPLEARAYPKPEGYGPSSARCSAYHGEDFILCAEGWKHGRPITGCEPHRPGSQFRGPYGLGKVARQEGGGCGREAALVYLQSRYGGSWSKAEAHHREKDWY